MAPDPVALRKIYDLLTDSQYWPAERMVDYQRSQLAPLLQHARAQSPFYRSRLDPVLRTGGRIDWDRWEEIPIMSRRDLIDHYADIKARTVPAAHGRSWEMESSGSTGQPIKVLYNDLFATLNRPFNWRVDKWHELDWSQTLITRTKDISLDEYPEGRSGGVWGPPWERSALAGREVEVGRGTPPEQLLKFFERTRPAYITCGPNALHMMTLEARRLNCHIHFRAAFSHGERVTDEAALMARKTFGTQLFERYSSREAGRMAHMCPHQNGLHINAEKVLVEIVDENGRACPPGVSGRVVVTPFYNTSSPLIRYEQGDIAVLGEQCTCGRTLPLIASVVGRMSAIFRHPDGSARHRYFPETAREKLRCGLWQLAQVGPLDFEIRYVPNDWDVPADEDAAIEIFRECYFADARVTCVRTKTLRATPADKYLEYVYEVPASAAKVEPATA